MPFYKAPDFVFVPLPIPFSFEGIENVAEREAETILETEYIMLLLDKMYFLFLKLFQTFAILDLTEFKWVFSCFSYLLLYCSML